MLSAIHAARPSGDACKHVGLGGIAGVADEGCAFVNCVNESTGALNFQSAVKLLYAGGIAAIVQGSMSAFENNTSAGNITSTAGARQFLFGGLVGSAGENGTDAACAISGCKLGGTIGGVEITAGNVSSYVIGNSAITPGTVTYWDGN